MTRKEVLSRIYGMANKLMKEFNRDVYNEMWDICYDWNREHEDEEIFMAEDEDEGRFYVEDDWFSYPE